MYFFKIRLTMKNIILLMVMSWSIQVMAEDPNSIYRKADALYEAGVYEEALQNYLKISDEGYISVGLYANIGACHYQLRSYPEAILYYEKALKLSPGNSRIIKDLKAAKSMLPENLPEMQHFILFEIWKKITGLMSEFTWAILNIFFFASIVILFGMKLRKTEKFTEKTYLILMSTVIVLFIISLSFGATASYIKNDNTGYIIMETGTTMKAGPDDISPEITELAAGSKVIRKDSIRGWLQVSTAYGDIGWIPADKASGI